MPDGPRIQRFLPLALIAILFLLGFPALSRYNVTWDEALGDFFFGERYLSYFSSFDPKYLDFAGNPYPPARVPDLSLSPFRDRPWEYYPVASILAAATSAVLSRGLGWLDPFDGFHAINLWLGAILLGSFFTFTRHRFGFTAALVGSLLLFLSPRIVCHLMANIKDFPEMVFFSVTLFAFFGAYEKGSVWGILGSGLLWGLALGTKANALFLPAIPLLLGVLGGIPECWKKRRLTLAAAAVGAGVLGLAVVFAAWPYLWHDSVGGLSKHFRYISLRIFQTRPESFAPPLEAVLLTTPIPFLLLFVVGLRPLLQRAFARQRQALFPLLWIAVVFGRLYLPNAVNFDGVRHFLELFPALALVAGIGASWCLEQIGKLRTGRRWVRVVAVLLVALAVGLNAWTVVRSHPFEIAYWNGLVGGLAGARARGKPQAGDYWGTSYRLGMRWINDHAPPGSLLAVPLLQHTVHLVASVRLRQDIGLANISTPVRPEIEPDRLRMLREVAADHPVYVMFVLREDWMNALMRECLEELTPVQEWSLDGRPVLLIYRYPGADSS